MQSPTQTAAKSPPTIQNGQSSLNDLLARQPDLAPALAGLAAQFRAAGDDPNRRAPLEWELIRRAQNERTLFACRGRRYAGCKLGMFRAELPAQAVVVARAMEFAENLDVRIRAGQNLLLVGPPGTGKDFILAALMRQAVWAGRTVAWENGVELCAAWSDQRRRRGAEAIATRELVIPSVLAVSDPLPPSGAMSRYEQRRWFGVTDARYSAGRATWATINATNATEIAAAMGRASWDRLRDSALVLVCDWASFRQSAEA